MSRIVEDYRCECGETDMTKFRGKVKNRCLKCNNVFKNIARAKRLSKNAEFIRDIKSSGCSKCGYSKSTNAIEFHHISPDVKDSEFYNMRQWKHERILKELEGCILLCANCHRELHDPNFET